MDPDKLAQIRLQNALLGIETPKWTFVVTLKDVDWSKGKVQYLEITEDTAITFSNAISGFRYVLKILIYSGKKVTGWDSKIRWVSGDTPLSSVVSGNTISYYGFLYLDNGASQVYDCIAEAEDLI